MSEIKNSEIMDKVMANIAAGLKLIDEIEKQAELWKSIDGYKNYSVSTEGRVRNDTTEKILKPRLNKKKRLLRSFSMLKWCKSYPQCS